MATEFSHRLYFDLLFPSFASAKFQSFFLLSHPRIPALDGRRLHGRRRLATQLDFCSLYLAYTTTVPFFPSTITSPVGFPKTKPALDTKLGKMQLLGLPLFALGSVSAHMMLSPPVPLRSKLNSFTNPAHIDYSMTSPLSSSGADFPCKGYHSLLNTPEGSPVVTWTAGSTQKFTLAGGGAGHGGGSCQASLSVDGVKTFRVLHSYIGGCPNPQGGEGGSSFEFHLPRDVPSSEAAVFAWTWFNNLGNREMYMNCAVVKITGGGQHFHEAGVGGGIGLLAHTATTPGLGNMTATTTTDEDGNQNRTWTGTGRYKYKYEYRHENANNHKNKTRIARGGTEIPFTHRPEIFTANIGNGCRTVDSKNVLFPNPGPDVTVVDTNAIFASGSCQQQQQQAGTATSGQGSAGHGDHHEGGGGNGAGAGAPGFVGGPEQGPGSGSGSGSGWGQGSGQGQSQGQGQWQPGNDWPEWFTSDAPDLKLEGVNRWTLFCAGVLWFIMF